MSARYTIFQSRAVVDPNLTDRELRVLALLGTYSDRNGWCFPHQQTLADRLGTSRQLVNRSIKTLVALSYIEKRDRYRDDGGIAGCEYRIMLDGPDWEDDECNASGTPPEPTAVHTLSRSEVTPPVTPEGDSNNVPNERSQKNDFVEELQLVGEKPIEPEQQVLEKYESLRGSSGWPAVKSFTTQRRKAVHARIAEHGLAEVLDALDRAARSDFLTGRRKGEGHGNWRCDFDFLMGPQKFAFLIEGKYDNRDETRSPASPDDLWDARVDSFLSAVEARQRPTWLESWGPRPWSEGSLVPPETLAKHQHRADAIRARRAKT